MKEERTFPLINYFLSASECILLLLLRCSFTLFPPSLLSFPPYLSTLISFSSSPPLPFPSLFSFSCHVSHPSFLHLFTFTLFSSRTSSLPTFYYFSPPFHLPPPLFVPPLLFHFFFLTSLFYLSWLLQLLPSFSLLFFRSPLLPPLFLFFTTFSFFPTFPLLLFSLPFLSPLLSPPLPVHSFCLFCFIFPHLFLSPLLHWRLSETFNTHHVIFKHTDGLFLSRVSVCVCVCKCVCV